MTPLENILRIRGPEGPLEAAVMSLAGAEDVVVIIPGSGPTDRDGNGPSTSLRTDAYKMLAKALAIAGISSLRIDKRGMFGSTAAVSDGNDVTVRDYADDARAWVRRAATLAPRVWLAGHSEGGLVALTAAQTPLPLHGVILMAAPGRPIGQVLLDQMRAANGGDGSVSETERVVASLEAGRAVDPDTMPTPLREMFPRSVQPYVIDLFSYDPALAGQGWSGPALILQGDADLQVTPSDATLLQAAMPEAVCRIVPGMTHVLKTGTPGEPMKTYTDPTVPLHPGLVSALIGFIRANKG